jgi:hypothetical protein
MQMMQTYTIRTKYRIAILIWFVNGIALLAGTLYLTPYLIVPLLILFVRGDVVD